MRRADSRTSRSSRPTTHGAISEYVKVAGSRSARSHAPSSVPFRSRISSMVAKNVLYSSANLTAGIVVPGFALPPTRIGSARRFSPGASCSA
jgi:hypothetical protein